mgnify:CR=1 FL=1
MKTKLFLSAAVLMALTALVSAQTAQTAPQVQPGQGQAAGNAWVDANNDGVCDNFENGTRPGRRAYSAGENQAAANRGPRKGQGMMAGRGAGKGQGMTAGRGAGRGHGMMTGRGPGRGHRVAPGRGLHNGQGPAFVDANKDGVCDNLATAPEKK